MVVEDDALFVKQPAAAFDVLQDTLTLQRLAEDVTVTEEDLQEKYDILENIYEQLIAEYEELQNLKASSLDEEAIQLTKSLKQTVAAMNEIKAEQQNILELLDKASQNLDNEITVIFEEK